MVEQIVDIISYFIIIQVSIFHNHTLSYEITLIMSTTCHDDFLEPILELDLPLVTLKLDHFQIPNPVAGKMCGNRGPIALEPNHDCKPSVLEQCPHCVAQVAHGFVEEYEVELVGSAFRVVRIQFVFEFIFEAVVEFVSVVGVLPGVLELLEYVDGLRLQFGLPLSFDEGLLVV